MPRLPFLRIHLLAQIEILKHIETLDLITLTFCSERTRALVESANIPLNQLGFHFIRPDDVKIFVNDDFSIKPKFTNIKNGDCKEALKSVEVIFKNNFRAVLKVVLLQNALVHGSLENMLIDHLMGTFRNVKHAIIQMDLERTGTPNLSVWKYRKTIDTFFCSSDETLSEEEIKFILHELTIKEDLTIFPPVVDGFKFSAGFQSELVRIECANWVHFDAILNSKSQLISLREFEKPSFIQLNTMLKLWMSMEKMQELKVLKLRLRRGNKFKCKFFTTVLERIVHIRHSPHSAEIRRVDGKVAKVVLEDKNELFFSTW